MSPAEVLAEATRIGLSLRAAGDRIVIRPARSLPPILAEEIRANRSGVLRLLAERSASPCTSCGAPTAQSDNLLCFACYAARRSPGRVPGFDPERRKRMEKRVADGRCPDCQTVDWTLNTRGDAWCSTCASRHYEGGPR